MKKIYSYLSIFFILTSFYSQAQVVQDSITLKDLEIPNAPGFMLLDKAPTLIERPRDGKAFSLSVLNSIDQSNGIPLNYAIDVVPFWYFKHPKMTSYKYIGYNAEKGRQTPFSQAKKFSLNFSYSGNKDTIASTPNHYFALGFRTTLLMIRSPKQIKEIKEANDRCVSYLKSIDEQLTDAGILYPLPTGDTAEFKKQLAKFYSDREKFINERSFQKDGSKKTLKEALSGKPLFAVDVASGYNSSFLDNSFSQNRFGRFGAWSTVSFSLPLSPKKNPSNYINLYALGRYIRDGLPMDTSLSVVNYLDAGGKFEFEFEKISVAYEYIYRFSDFGETYRSNGIIKFKVSQNVYLTAAFGKNFGNANDLISMLGLNWGIGSGNEKATIIK
jgi:hypothetical protein